MLQYSPIFLVVFLLLFVHITALGKDAIAMAAERLEAFEASGSLPKTERLPLAVVSLGISYIKPSDQHRPAVLVTEECGAHRRELIDPKIKAAPWPDRENDGRSHPGRVVNSDRFALSLIDFTRNVSRANLRRSRIGKHACPDHPQTLTSPFEGFERFW
ncbi:MAG: hypothetical protein JO068_19150, partial [Hyphomicrobiales bacterium]|nr:hypothetical protein [Hyphomicrobiales bacterium]